ncbi:MAG: transposase [Candidatus Brocadiales bacterium]
MGKLVRFDFPENIHFITTSCYNRLSLFSSDKMKTTFIQSVKHIRNKYDFKLFGYIIMPEHIHLLLQTQKDKTVSDVMREIKQTCAFNALQILKTNNTKSTLEKLKRNTGRKTERKYNFWKPRFYDFNIYSEKKFKEKLDYCHKNPVTRGLVNDPSEWRFYSYRNYFLNDDSIISIDPLETSPPGAQG